MYVCVAAGGCVAVRACPQPYAADLSPSSTVQDVVARLDDVLGVMRHSMVPPHKREQVAAPIITAFLDPLLHMCRLSAEGLDKTDTCVYLINNITAMQAVLVPYDFTQGWVQKLRQELERWEEALVSEQTRAILHDCSITAKLGAIATHDPSVRVVGCCVAATLCPVFMTLVGHHQVPLSNIEGMDLASLTDSLKVFYSALFELEIGAFGRLLNSQLRKRAQVKVARLLATAYQVRCRPGACTSFCSPCGCRTAVYLQKLHSAITDPANGYSGTDALLLHSPEQVRNLLDLD